MFHVIKRLSPSAYVSLPRTSTSTQPLVHGNHNTTIQTSAPCKLTKSKHENIANTNTHYNKPSSWPNITITVRNQNTESNTVTKHGCLTLVQNDTYYSQEGTPVSAPVRGKTRQTLGDMFKENEYVNSRNYKDQN